MSTGAAIISTDHPDAVTDRRTAGAFRAGDLDALASTIHEDVIWHPPGATWMARDFEGRGTLLAYLRDHGAHQRHLQAAGRVRFRL